MVDRRMSKDAVDFASVVREALADAGGFGIVMRTEADPDVRTDEVEPLLGNLGVWELDTYADSVQLEAAASVCRVAGTVALPYPLAGRLACPVDLGADALALTFDDMRVSMADLPLRWAGIDRLGNTYKLVPTGQPLGTKLGHFVMECTASDLNLRPADALTMALNLSSFTLLGMLESAFDVTLAHVRERTQFGAALISFQAVQYQLADALVSLQMVEQLAHYALWSQTRGTPASLVDAVAVRVSALECADVVFRTGHQLHGATGFCDETPISWLSRYSQALRRLPDNAPAAESWLTALICERGLDGLFPSTVTGVDGAAEQTAGHIVGAVDGANGQTATSPPPRLIDPAGV